MIRRALQLAQQMGVKVPLNSPGKEDPLREDLALTRPKKPADTRRGLSYLRVHTNGDSKLVPRG